jgi:hypothetical protein
MYFSNWDAQRGTRSSKTGEPRPTEFGKGNFSPYLSRSEKFGSDRFTEVRTLEAPIQEKTCVFLIFCSLNEQKSEPLNRLELLMAQTT